MIFSRKELANAIRILSIDAIEQAGSGHPGASMGMADIAEVLWRSFLKHNPKNPNWINRDRFVLSNGHACILQYSLLHLTGYALSIEDIKNFRQLNTITPGHPEYGCTPGVEATTGPLGQGLANAVGIAIAEKTLAVQFNRPKYPIVDHYTYVFAGDGCLMEGLSHEVCSLAGTLGLGKLILFYDDNGISIDGTVQQWFTDNTALRFTAYGWHVISAIDGHCSESILHAIEQAKQTIDRPSLLICKTVIGYGSPNKAGSASCHGNPMGVQEVLLIRKQLRWTNKAFDIPQKIYELWDATEQGVAAEERWQRIWDPYSKVYPNLATEFQRRIRAQLPSTWSKHIKRLIFQLQRDTTHAISTRKASQNIIQNIAPLLPELFGGSADLTPSTLTSWSGTISIKNSPDGNYLNYGARELGMVAIMNGIALHRGFIPYGGTFLVFNDYACSAVRMAALMKQRVIFIYTHDSIALGGDGPTHQPIEQIAALRSVPNLMVWRPCDSVETAVAWNAAIKNINGPTALILSRQKVPQQTRLADTLINIQRGGYILCENHSMPQLILIATGSEVALAVAAYHKLCKIKHKVRVVSMPSVEYFAQESVAYRTSVLPSTVNIRLVIEAASPNSWYRYINAHGAIIGISSFGCSGPSDQVLAKFGFTVDNVVHTALDLLNKKNY